MDRRSPITPRFSVIPARRDGRRFGLIVDVNALAAHVADRLAGPQLVLSTGGFRSERPAGRPELGTRTGTRPAGYTTGGGGGGPRPPRGGPPAPKPERYWTDYLRIALPVIGLILMLSVFIFWVDSIIGNDSDTPETPVALSTATVDPNAAQATETLAPSEPTEAPSQPAAAPTEEGEAASDAPADASTQEPAGEPTEEPAGDATEEPADDAAEEPAGDGEFAVGDAVVTSEGGVALRSEASVDGGETTVLVRMDQGTSLTIVGGPEPGESYDWYEVETEDGESGWVASTLLEAANG